MTEILLPIGQPLGTTGTLDPATGQRSPQVRVADGYLDLDTDEYRLWLMAYGLGDRAEVEKTAAGNAQIPEAPRRLDQLLDEGVLVAYDPEGDLTVSFKDLCLLPTGIALGASPDVPGSIQIAGFDLKPRADVEADVFLLWSRGPRHSVASSFDGLAEDFEMDLRTVGRRVALGVRDLVVSGCAFLDRLP